MLSEVRAKKPSLTLNLGTNGLKVTSEPPPMAGQAGRLQGQDRTAVACPSSGHARRCLIWLSCDNRRTHYTAPLAHITPPGSIKFRGLAGGAPPSPLFLSACHDHPIEHKREELVHDRPIEHTREELVGLIAQFFHCMMSSSTSLTSLTVTDRPATSRIATAAR
ncbi:hypothetical protein J6590_021285 [Homalodisca vitripennis]|nr:hypothetical protein J6590_021285 [Homalodisca vitripennis]